MTQNTAIELTAINNKKILPNINTIPSYKKSFRFDTNLFK